MAEEQKTVIMVSEDEGKTWTPMPKNWKREGRIVSSTPDVVVQSLGRGREAWYSVALEEEAPDSDG